MTGRHAEPTLGAQMRRAAEVAMAGLSERALAMAGVRLCGWCRDRHFRAYPESPGSSCPHVGCECWCVRGTGQ